MMCDCNECVEARIFLESHEKDEICVGGRSLRLSSGRRRLMQKKSGNVWRIILAWK